jgi:hypothetical protein
LAEAAEVTEPTFFTVLLFERGPNDFMIHGIYSKREDAEARATEIPTAGTFGPHVVEMGRSQVVTSLIANHIAFIAADRRVSIVIEPLGQDRVKLTPEQPA